MRSWRAALVLVAVAGCSSKPGAVANVPPDESEPKRAVVDKLDLLLMVDDSPGMGDKQRLLALTVPDLAARLVNPRCVDATGVSPPSVAQPATPADPCPPGTMRELTPFADVHVGVVTSSLGSGGANACKLDPSKVLDAGNNPTKDDAGHLVHRLALAEQPGEDFSFPSQVDTHQACAPGASSPCTTADTGFLAWGPDDGTGGSFHDPPGTSKAAMFSTSFAQIVTGADEVGCGFEAQMEAWYRFLVDPSPPKSVTVPALGMPAQVSGVDDVVLQERSAFLRPDSVVAIVVLSDEDDHSFVVGTLPDLPLCRDVSPAAGIACWPDEYQVQNDYDASGLHPFGYNYLALQLGGGFHMMSGTSPCADDPHSPDCHECFSDTSGPGCHLLGDAEDGPDLRQWNAKQRFGWDPQTPMQKYVDALTSQQIIDFNRGKKVPNPLFDDLPYDAAQAAEMPLRRGKFPPRSPKVVFLTTIVGVPWQDVARIDPGTGQPDLSLGYMTAEELGEKHPIAGVTGWDLVLGNPYDPSQATRTQPVDPLMIDTPTDRMHPRFPEGTTHPVTGEALGFDVGWNHVNGHEWITGNDDLGYACIFPIPPIGDATGSKLCTDPSRCDCSLPTDPATNMPSVDLLQATDNPLCEPPTASDPPVGSGQDAITTAIADGVEVGVQYWAKAYPGKRFLEIQKRLAESGGNAVVASICPKNPSDPTASDYAYRPAVDALVRRMASVLR